MVDYKSAGVDPGKKESSLKKLLEYVNATFDYNRCKPLLPIGYFANVLDLRPLGVNIGIAFSTDGVGTKLLVAEAMKKYDTVGIDCVAMNVNDLLCVGATPISMVDYIAVNTADPAILAELGKGLDDGCKTAGVNLPGGEIAQVAELLAPPRQSGISFDMVGTAIGTVDPSRLIVGQELRQGDRIVGLESTGLHSNGYSLARKIMFDVAGLRVDSYRKELGCTVGEEMIKPTRIYVKEVVEMMKNLPIKGLFHITGDGLFNLTRTRKPVGYVIEKFPTPPPIFGLLQNVGSVPWEEMFRVFNMGIGFVVAVPDESGVVKQVQAAASAAGYKAHELGYVTEDPERKIILKPYGLTGKAGSFTH